MCFPRHSARVCCEERAQARRQAHHASRLVGARKESSALMRRTAGMTWSGKAAPQQRLPVPPLFKRAHDTCMMQPHVQFAAHNNAAEVALVQQHATMALLLLL